MADQKLSRDQISTYPMEPFFEDIRHQLDLGFGFVPLIGAGASAASGVPLTPEIRAYLSGCMLRVFGIDKPEDEMRRRWNPQTDRWPPFADLTTKYANEVYRQLSQHVQKLRDEGTDRFQQQVAQEALGALADWRSALLFLSRVRMDRGERKIAYLGPPDYDVVDRFLVHATGGKRPCLAHHMLAQLAEPLRFETLLTTNFEDLVEQAFRDASLPLDVVEVHLDAQLPSRERLSSRRVLVKLHGGRYGLRADYSLDQDPTFDEQRAFSSYFGVSGPRLRDEPQQQAKRKSLPSAAEKRNHAIVCGISGGERRVVDLLSNVVWNSKDRDRKNPGIRVYWICYSKGDEQTILESFRSMNVKYGRAVAVATSRNEFFLKSTGEDTLYDVHIVRHQFLGLFLHEIFEAVTGTVPAKHAVFPSPSRLCVPPAHLMPDTVQLLSEQLVERDGSKYRELAHRAEAHITSADRETRRLVRVCEKKPDHKGIVSAGVLHFYRALAKGRHCVWLPLEGMGCADEVFEQITDAVARTAGHSEWMPIALYHQRAKAVRELNRLTEGRNEWVIFLDARDGAGHSLGQFPDEPTEPNGWLDHELSQTRSKDELVDPTMNGESFADLLVDITGPQCPNIMVVLLYHKHTRSEAGELSNSESKLHQCLERRKLGGKAFEFEEGLAFVETAVEGKRLFQPRFTDHADAAIAALSWALTDTRRMYFLLGLAAAQRARHSAMLFDDAFWPPGSGEASERPPKNDVLLERRMLLFGSTRQKKVKSTGWISELQKRFVVRIMPGGLIWMHAQTKRYLRQALGLHFEVPERESMPISRVRLLRKEPWAFPNSSSGLLSIEDLRKMRGPDYVCVRVHVLQARWYERLFASSSDALAGLEAVYHYLEAAKHTLSFMHTGKHAYPRKTKWDRRIASSPHVQLEESLAAALRVLQHTRQPALMSGHPKAACRRLEFLRIMSLDVLKEGIDTLKDSSDARWRDYTAGWSRLLKQASLQAIYINHAVAREVAEHARAFFRHRQYLANLAEIRLEDEASTFFSDSEIADMDDNALRKMRPSKQCYSAAAKKDFWSVVRWIRQSGTVALQTRAYPFAITKFCQALREGAAHLENEHHTFDQSTPPAPALSKEFKKLTHSSTRILAASKISLPEVGNLHSQIEAIVDSDAEVDPNNLAYQLLGTLSRQMSDSIRQCRIAADNFEDRDQPAELLRTLSRLVQLCVCHLESLDFCLRSRAENSIQQVCVVARSASQTFRRLLSRTRIPEQDSHEFFELKHDMEVQMSTIWARLGHWKKAHDSIEAAIEAGHRMDPLQSELGAGVVELHRAQLFLLQARKLSSNITQLDPIIPGIKNKLQQLLKDAANARLGGQSRHDSWWADSIIKAFDVEGILKKWNYPSTLTARESFLQSVQGGFRQLDDADAACHKAAIALVSKRKNVWWSTWLFELQAKVIEYRLLLEIAVRIYGFEPHELGAADRIRGSADDFGSRKSIHISALRDVLIRRDEAFCIPVPIFGTQACPRRADTDLDQALKRTLRMVRLDVLRMTRVVESYARCHWGLAVLIRLNDRFELLADRQRMMRERLVGGQNLHLGSAIDILRSRYETRCHLPPMLDPFTAVYARRVLEFADQAAHLTPIIE